MKTYLATLILALTSATAIAVTPADIQAIDAQIAALKAQRAAAVKALDPVERAELRVIAAQEGLRKARNRAGKAPKAARRGVES